MAEDWEGRLYNLAYGGEPWTVPNVETVIEKLNEMKSTLDRVAGEPGIRGDAGDAAESAFASISRGVAQLVDHLQAVLPTPIRDGNAQREKAQRLYGALPAGSLSSEQEAGVRGAAAGTTLVLGPLAIVAGEGALQLINGHLASQRREAAKNAVEQVSDGLDDTTMQEPKVTWTNAPSERPRTDDPTDQRSYGGGGSGGGGGRSFQAYPNFDVPPSPPLPGGATYADPNAGSGSSGLGSGSGGSGPHGGRVIDLTPGGSSPTADGSIGGVKAMPGSGNLSGLGPGGSAGAGGLGSGLSAGLVAGAGGAAALNRLGRAGSAAEAGAAGRGVSGTGGLLGKSGSTGASGAGSGMGVRSGVGGVGAMGGAAGAGAPGTAGARGAGMRAGVTGAGGTGGAGTSGGPAGGGAVGGGGAAGGRGVGGMGAGGDGSRSDRRDQGQGLGGPIAPRMEDDDEIGPRSENAGAGSRE